jgi:hypothetical protein
MIEIITFPFSAPAPPRACTGDPCGRGLGRIERALVQKKSAPLPGFEPAQVGSMAQRLNH